jgi:hypothetical protein
MAAEGISAREPGEWNMTRLTLTGLTVAGVLSLAIAGTANAQYAGQGFGSPFGGAGFGSPYGRPQLTPYLNLLRGGSPAANYYLGVVPERERRSNAAQFGAAINDLEWRTRYGTAGELDLAEPITSSGHPATFLNTGSYFAFPVPTRAANTSAARRSLR